MNKLNIRTEWKNFKEILLSLDRKVIVIFLAVAILQTISYYISSRRFFRANIFPLHSFEENIYLYEYLYWFVSDFVTFFVLPFLVIRYVLKEKISDFGIRTGDWQIGVKISAIFFVVMLPLIWFASASPSFTSKYPHLLSVREVWDKFFIYELGMLIYMFGWEFIWRGFMLFGLEAKFGYYAILIQMIPFVILHNGKPMPETFGAILGGIALGILAFRTRSFLYGVIVHMGVMFTIDLICTLRFRADDYGLGIYSLFNIIRELF